VESNTFFRGLAKVLRASAHPWMRQVCTFCFRSKFLNICWKPEHDSNIAGAPSVQIPQTYFHCHSAQSKMLLLLQDVYTCCSLQFLTKEELLFNVYWMNISHENKQFSKWSNICWLMNLKRKHWRCFHLSPGLSYLPAYLNCASE